MTSGSFSSCFGGTACEPARSTGVSAPGPLWPASGSRVRPRAEAGRSRRPSHCKAAVRAARVCLALIPRRARVKSRTHRIVRGETLTTISRRYGVSVKSIARAPNRLDPRRYIIAGAQIRIPALPRAWP